jgi:hypothetical protein
MIAGCVNNSLLKDEIVLRYSCEIPDNLPREEVFHGKTFGPEEIRKCYEGSYEAGWKGCLNTFLSGKLYRDTTISEAYLYHQDLEAPKIFFHGIEQGFEGCKKSLSMLVAKHGYKSVKQALDFKLTKLEVRIYNEKYIDINPISYSAAGFYGDCLWQYDFDRGIDVLNAYMDTITTPISIRRKRDLDSLKVNRFIEEVSSRYPNVSVEMF